MKRPDVQTQVDELRDRIEDLRARMDETLSSLRDIRARVTQTQKEAAARAKETRAQVQQVGARTRERVPGGNLLLVASVVAVATSALAFVLFSPRVSNQLRAALSNRLGGIMTRRP